MRFDIQLTPKAEDDLLQVWLFVAHENPKAADKLLADIERADIASRWRRLSQFPMSGEARTDLQPAIRRQVTRQYQTLYQIDAETIIIVRVLAPKGRPIDGENNA